MNTRIKELPCNWRVLRNLGRGPDFVWPAIDTFEAGVDICCKKESILLPLHERKDIDLIELRNWMGLRCRNSYKMFNRFGYTEQNYKIIREYFGVNFRFDAIDDAFYFKLYWV